MVNRLMKWHIFASELERRLGAIGYRSHSLYNHVLVPAKGALGPLIPPSLNPKRWRGTGREINDWCKKTSEKIVLLGYIEKGKRDDPKAYSEICDLIRAAVVELSRNEGWEMPEMTFEKYVRSDAETVTNSLERMDRIMKAFDCFLRVCKDGKLVSMKRLTSEELVVAVDATQARAKCLMMDGIAKAVAEDADGETRIVLVEVNAL